MTSHCLRSLRGAPRLLASLACVLLAPIGVASARTGVCCEPGAQPTESVAEVFAHVRTALGIDALGSHPHGVWIEGSGTMAGMSCTLEQVMNAKGQSARRLIGPITTESGSTAEHYWARDIGGEPRILGLREAAEACINTMILTGAWLEPSAPLAFSVKESDAGAVVLAFTISGATMEGTLRIDAATWRPVRWEFVSGDVMQTIELEGDIALGALHFPATITESSSHGASTVLTITDVRPATAAEAARLVPDLSPPRDTRFDPALPPGLEVRKAPTGHLLVHPTINGKDVGWFIFDTGAGANVLSASATETLGLERFGEVPAVGVGGATAASFVRPDSLTLGSYTQDNPLMVVLDLAFLSPYMGVEVGGVIGYSLLARTVAEVDLGEATIALHDPATFDRAGLVWGDLIVDDRVPCVRASFEGHEGWFRLDTGANTTVTFHEPAVREFNLLEGRETSETKLGGVGGFVKARVGKLEWFEIGGQRIENLNAEFAVEAKGAFGNATSLGNIGTKLVSPYRLVLDYPRGKIAFVAHEGADAPKP